MSTTLHTGKVIDIKPISTVFVEPLLHSSHTDAHFIMGVLATATGGRLRAVPEIILGGAFFFRFLHPQDKHGVRAPRPPRHVL